MSNTAEWKEIAAQLRQPNGTKGVEVAEMMNQSNIGMIRHAIDRLDLQEGHRVLELGHGNALHLDYLFRKQQKLTYAGLDIADLMHQEAKRINALAVESRHASFHLYDGRHIPFPENHFDRIFTVNTLYFWDDPQALLLELYRVTAPGGMLNITIAPKDFMEQLPFTVYGFTLYDDEALLALVGQTPFKLIDTDKQTEIVKTKTGEPVNRPFATFTIGK